MVTVVKGAVIMNKVKETSTNQLDMGSLTQIKSFDEEIKKLSELLVKLNPITEQISNRIANLRTDASYYKGMINTDVKAFQKWFNQSNYKQNLNGIKELINTAGKLLSDEDTSSDTDYDWMDACGEATICYYDSSCNQTCAYTPDCNETIQDEYTVDDDGGLVCTFTGDGCTETCGECGETTIPDPISECALPGCDDAGCMEQIACGEICTQTVDCDETVCDQCNHYELCSHLADILCGQPDLDDIETACSNIACSYRSTGIERDTPENCTFGCSFNEGNAIGRGPDNCTFTCSYDIVTEIEDVDNCTFTCSYGGEISSPETCTYSQGEVSPIPCDEQINCNQTTTCTHACGLTVCDDSAGCGETCEHNAEDCGDCFFGGCEAGDGDCFDCADCAEGDDCGDWCSHSCADGTDLCGEDCGDSCGL